MLRNIKDFFKIEFRIEECDDDVFDSDDEEMDEAGEHEMLEDQMDNKDEPNDAFPKTFIFSCLGVGMTNYARKTE